MNLRRKIEGVLTRQAAKQAGAIRAALRNSLDVDALVADWERQNFTTMSKADARAWAQMNAQPRNLKAIRAAVLQAVATGYLLGQNAAQAYYAKAKTGRKLVKAAPTAEDIDSWLDADFWDNWTAGNKPAALLVRPPGALSDLLDKAGATINGLNRTTMNRLGTILGDGLERGLSGKSIADAIESLLDDPARALTIANTEMARAMSTASMDTYNGFGVEMVEWLHADFCTCELCTEAEAMGPQPIGFDWSMGDGVTEPPMHPNCICAIAPVIDEGDGSGLDLFDFGDVLEMSATINKYDPDQPRDELGRFGSGGGSNSGDSKTREYIKTRPEELSAKDIVENFKLWDAEAYGLSNETFLEAKLREVREPSFYDYNRDQMIPNKQYGLEESILQEGVQKPIEAELDSKGRAVLLEGHTRLSIVFGNDPNAKIPIRWIDADDADKSLTILKYDPDQPRDELGRFGSGGGSNPTQETATEGQNYALNVWQSQDYIELNSAVRSDRPMTAWQENRTNDLKSLIEQSKLEEEVTTYRGIQGYWAKELYTLNIGEQFVDKGFVASSTDRNTASNFTRQGQERLMIVMENPVGTRALDVDAFRGIERNTPGLSEGEFIHAPNTAYEITGKDVVGGMPTLFVRVSNE